VVTFTTAKPKSLSAAFKKGVEAGDISTWEKTKADHYTHTSTQWAGKAAFEVIVDTRELRFRFTDVNRGDKTYAEVYAFYHGTIIRTFLDHFGDDFESATATAKARATK
jgi:hypothetical protein